MSETFWPRGPNSSANAFASGFVQAEPARMMLRRDLNAPATYETCHDAMINERCA